MVHNQREQGIRKQRRKEKGREGPLKFGRQRDQRSRGGRRGQRRRSREESRQKKRMTGDC
eukprot:6525625-Karenia_brevis.AAC.1